MRNLIGIQLTGKHLQRLIDGFGDKYNIKNYPNVLSPYETYLYHFTYEWIHSIFQNNILSCKIVHKFDNVRSASVWRELGSNMNRSADLLIVKESYKVAPK